MAQETVTGFVQHAADISLETRGEVEIVDLTEEVRTAVRASGVQTGQCLVFTLSSTSAITTIEHEPGLLRDLPAALERLMPRHGEGVEYGHEEAWQAPKESEASEPAAAGTRAEHGNGHSHIRASFLKPDLVLPVEAGELVVGTWQQVVFVELDNKPRRRRVVVRVWGTG